MFRNYLSFQMAKCVSKIWKVYLKFVYIVNGIILVIWKVLVKALILSVDW